VRSVPHRKLIENRAMTDFRETLVRRRLLVDPKDIDWSPPRDRPQWWPDDPDTRRFTEWLRAMIPAEEWSRRRLAHFFALYGAGEPFRREDIPEVPYKLDADGDRGGWYLFLAEAWIDHIRDYEPAQGSRVIPLFQRLGCHFGLLLSIKGVADRAKRILTSEMKQPDGALFELIVAVAYRRAGWEVEFIDETPDHKTPDFVVMGEAGIWSVECKRMSKSLYSRVERDQFWRRWRPAMSLIEARRLNYFYDLDFRAEVQDVPEDYLLELTHAKIRRNAALVVDDQWAVGTVNDIDLGPIQKEIKQRPVCNPSHQMFALLTGDYQPTRSYAGAMMTHAWSEHPRYVDEIEVASIARWQCSNPEALRLKSNHFRRQLVGANAQLKGWGPAVVHLGFEAMESELTEAARAPKLKDMVLNFDPQGTLLFWTYIHHFSF